MIKQGNCPFSSLKPNKGKTECIIAKIEIYKWNRFFHKTNQNLFYIFPVFIVVIGNREALKCIEEEAKTIASDASIAKGVISMITF